MCPELNHLISIYKKQKCQEKLESQNAAVLFTFSILKQIYGTRSKEHIDQEALLEFYLLKIMDDCSNTNLCSGEFGDERSIPLLHCLKHIIQGMEGQLIKLKTWLRNTGRLRNTGKLMMYVKS